MIKRYVAIYSTDSKYGISRDDIVLGRILGEGFFGEVHEGVYKQGVRPLWLSSINPFNGSLVHT